MRLQSVEAALPIDTRPDNITIDQSFDALTCTINATIPATFTINSAGHREAIPTEYTPAPFAPGSSDLSSTNLQSAFVEAATLLQNSEQQVTGDNPPDNIQVSSDDGQISVSAVLPMTFALDSAGNTVITVPDYIP